MTKFDFHRRAAADRQRRQGSDRINDFDVPVGFRSPPRKRQSKADARAELEALMASHEAQKVKPDTRGRIELRKPHQQK
ncbi:hypothetical protein NIK97_06685 [Brucella pseudintermedia]|uniref:Uncharacterized protein n=1 Tax=Brucella pseudintermedia TaxID=370111 RepID=A0ABY5U8N4_9HYPH|nr:hypothetical protein [Brucella pseudintermedia]UWL59236.1 hypothetical protein NIK97_06685 [Brucella pseudintermedia]